MTALATVSAGALPEARIEVARSWSSWPFASTLPEREQLLVSAWLLSLRAPRTRRAYGAYTHGPLITAAMGGFGAADVRDQAEAALCLAQ